MSGGGPCLEDLQLTPLGEFFKHTRGALGTCNLNWPYSEVIVAFLWWQPDDPLSEAIKLKKKAFQSWKSRVSPEKANKYQMAKRAAVAVVAEAQTLGRPQVTFGKPFNSSERHSRVCPMLSLVWVNNCWPKLEISLSSGRSTLRIFLIQPPHPLLRGYQSLRTWGNIHSLPWQRLPR